MIRKSKTEILAAARETAMKKKKVVQLMHALDIPALMWLHSSRSIKAALKADMVVRDLFDEMARKPGDKMLESHVATIMKSHHVSRAFVFRALDQLGPERRKRMEQAAVTVRTLRSKLSSLTK